MTDHDHSPARRDAIKTAAIGLGLAAGLLPAAARAQAAAAGPAEPWSSEYWARKGAVELNLWRKRLGAPQAGEAARPVLFLVHGSSNSARTSYDLIVPGKGEYSLMNVFARYGFDVWTMDHEGHGKSSRTARNSHIAPAVADLRAPPQGGARETGRPKK